MHSGPTSFSGSDQEWARQIEERLSRLEKVVVPQHMETIVRDGALDGPAPEVGGHAHHHPVTKPKG